MEYILAYLVISILAGLFIGRFIYVGHAEDENRALDGLNREEKEKLRVPSEESREKVSRALVSR